MQLNGTQTAIAIVVVVVLVVGLGYLLFTRSGPPTPTLGPGQTIQNPFGDVPPHGGRGGGPSGAQGGPAGGTLPQGAPAAGTFDKQQGFGPSVGGPFRRK